MLVADKTGLLYGVYKNTEMLYCLKKELKTLDALSVMWDGVKRKHHIEQICYARGPGSLSAIKLVHIFVQTLHIVSGMKIFATDSFYFNQSAPIHAFGNQFFFKEQGEIVLRTSQEEVRGVLALPQSLRLEDFSQPTTPLYIVPPL